MYRENSSPAESNMDALSKKFAENLEKYPLEVRIVVNITMVNVLNGCSWGFVGKTNKTFNENIEKINAHEKMAAIPLKNGYLVQMDFDYLVSILDKTARGLISYADLMEASKKRNAAIHTLDKFMANGKGGKIGIYNLNDSNTITEKGVTYPAFAVTMSDLLSICSVHGYYLNFGGKRR